MADEESVWDILGLEDPAKEDASEEYEELQDEMDDEISKEEKVNRKVSAKFDEMQKKFDNTMLKMNTEKFLANATEMEVDLFKAVAGDVHDPETLDKVVSMVREKAAKLEEATRKYEEELSKQAEQKVQSAWGLPVGVAKTSDEEEKDDTMERVAAGDSKAALHALFGDDEKLGRFF